MTRLEFLIPSYKRPESVLRAAASVASQVDARRLSERVVVTIQDDCSPNIDIEKLRADARAVSPSIQVRRNARNLGMSGNILSMVEQCAADFCTILTDDDYLQDDVLGSIIERLDALTAGPEEPIAALFTPRFSYTEDGELHAVVCNPLERSSRIEPSPEAALRFAPDGFILTGLIFRPDRVDTALWREHADNAFFPVIYFGQLLLTEPVAYVDENWFSHTVLNECHWSAWGDTEREQSARLFADYLLAIRTVAEVAHGSARRRSLPALLALEAKDYEDQLCVMTPKLGLQAALSAIPWHQLARSPAFHLALWSATLRLSSGTLRRRVRSSLQRLRSRGPRG